MGVTDFDLFFKLFNFDMSLGLFKLLQVLDAKLMGLQEWDHSLAETFDKLRAI